jgi:ferredoxin
MAFVVTEPCFGCKYTDCVVVCPADCFYEGQSMLFIHPDECVDCGACTPECPVEAIYYQDEVPAVWREYVALNAEMAPKCPKICERKTPLDGKNCRSK